MVFCIGNTSCTFFIILSECKIHSNHIFWIFSTAEFFLLYRLKHLIRNNGLMRIGVEIPIHEAIIFYLGSTSADSFLEQYPPRVFFIGEQLIECFPVPFGLSGGREDTFFSKPSAIVPRLLPLRY